MKIMVSLIIFIACVDCFSTDIRYDDDQNNPILISDMNDGGIVHINDAGCGAYILPSNPNDGAIFEIFTYAPENTVSIMCPSGTLFYGNGGTDEIDNNDDAPNEDRYVKIIYRASNHKWYIMITRGFN